MTRKSEAVRNREQKERQRTLRAKQKAEKRPGRDDVARVLLHWFIRGATVKGREHELDRTGEIIVKRLVEQGFDEAASYAVFDALVDKYGGNAWGFRRKPHLLYPPEVNQDE
ncbi:MULTISPECIES: hypothetical protein [Rhizobiaceae]|uniref:Uncharacterized protein n=1 Tax=Ferranicluibacter rubi TaxID=2715133 RepID=A0AA43ZAZ1_9HYPH|nr:MULTISPECIES: hypothetical protein [Rhizobiaceae]NHT74204.1 hypothetical protein [Ferranicluibacter rubi]TCQ12066.1 hypothetical protein C8J34_101704 [Rhizobium sp. PP-F2F-G36]SER95942.1 hypothetical protein SAMN03159406_01756 [Rhizobium sp. NFR03]